MARKLLVIALLPAGAPVGDALAAAGGGTSGYGGGGGGGGFGGGGSGSGSGEGSWEGVLFLVAIALVFLTITAVGHIRYSRRRRARVRRVELAAAEAAGEDPAFAPDAVVASAETLFGDVQASWDARDRERLARLVGADLLEEWTRRLDDFDRKQWHSRVAIVSGPKVEYVGLTNRAGEQDDRVVVRYEATLRDYVEDGAGRRIHRTGKNSEIVEHCEYWTLARRDGGWILESIEQRAEGDHHLEGEIVATPWADRETLHSEAVAECAAAGAPPPGFSPADLADLDFDGTARAAALDLALADGRFDPDLIEASVRRAVAAWVQAVDGDDAALEAVARPAVAGQLLYPGDGSRRTRLVVRGLRVDSVRIAALDAAAAPPALAVEVRVSGRRYVEDRDTAAVLSGSRDREVAFAEHWTLGLEGPPAWPWRMIRAGAPAAA